MRSFFYTDMDNLVFNAPRPDIRRNKDKTEDIFLIHDFSNLISSELTNNINSYSNYNPPFLSFRFKENILQPPEPIGHISV